MPGGFLNAMRAVSDGQQGYQQAAQDQGANPGDQLVGRIMSAEYNLAAQRGDGRQAMGILGQMLGQWLQIRFSR